MKKIVLVLIWFLFPAISWADELVLVKGKGVKVCEAHLKNLKTLELNEMVCKRDESYPESNGITRPKWEELDLRENKELVKKLEKFFSFGDQFKEDKMFDSEGYFNNQPLKYSSLKKTTADIDNDGKPEIVMLYRMPRCDVERNKANNMPYSQGLYLLDKAKNQIDVKKTEPLLDPLKEYTNFKVKYGSYTERVCDVLLYKKDTYFDKWDIYNWILTVYKLSNDRGSEVCRYQYKQTLKNKED